MKATRRDVLALAAGATALGAWPASAQTGSEAGDLRASTEFGGLRPGLGAGARPLLRSEPARPRLAGGQGALPSAGDRRALARGRRRLRSMRCWRNSARPTLIIIRRRIRPTISSPTYSSARSSIGASTGVFPKGEVAYPGIGAFTEPDSQGRIFVTGAIDGAPARQAGVLVGDEILSADDRPFRPVDSFRGKVGVPVPLQIRRAPGAAPFAISVTPADLHPGEMFLRGLQGQRPRHRRRQQ